MNTNEKPTEATLNNWHNNPENWKLGFLYFNKEDKRIFPPKRNKYLGWTVNFANPISILAIIVIIAIVVIVPKMF